MSAPWRKVALWLWPVVGFCAAEPPPSPPPSRFVVNQVGYLPAWPKVAILIGGSPKSEGGEAEIVSFESRKPVFMAPIAPARVDPQTGDTVQTVDFSGLREAGRYLLRAGATESYPFEIGPDIYRVSLRLLLRSYYLQRCGVAIDDTATAIKHAACHVHDGTIAHDDTVHKAGDRVAATGGWHDAGDYGKYVATTAVAVGRLLSLYEQHPELFSDGDLNIPESGNGLPDLLDEMKVGLDWMLAMQRTDGAVYRKLSGKIWPHSTPPDYDEQPRFLYGITTPETAKAAAAWAMAARIYKGSRPKDAARYLEAARKAWQFLEQRSEQMFDYREGDNSGSGPYMLNKTDSDESLARDLDDRLWAAVELYLTTGEKKWANYSTRGLPDEPLHLFDWKNPVALAFEHYLWQAGRGDRKGLKEDIQRKIIDRANTVLETVAYSGYRIANGRFIWSSNKMTAEEGLILLQAYRLSGQRRYLEAAIDQVDYLLGRNHFNLAFASGIGTNPVAHVSHQFARAAKINIPGLFVGGPNALEQSDIGPKFKGPLSYIDDERSYGTNEYAIDYNASFIALLVQAITVGAH